MQMGRLVLLALIGAVLTLAQPSLAQVTFGQASGTPQDDGSDQTPTVQAPPDMAPPDQVAPDQAAQDQAPAVAADDAHWWLKRGGSTELEIVFPLTNDYRQFWRSRTEALSELDDLFLMQVMFGPALAAEQGAINQFEAQGKAEIVVVENHPQVWYASEGEAVIYDPYVSRNYFVDVRTRKPLGDGPNVAPFTASLAYHLTKHPNYFGQLLWMVDDSVGIVQ